MITYNGITKRDDWECYSWTFITKGIEFKYYTGLGHATKGQGKFNYLKPKALGNKKVIKDGIVFIHVPKIKSILYALALDAQSGDDFCSNFGYDTDSCKALAIYLECQESDIKLRKIMKSKNALDRILAWEL